MLGILCNRLAWLCEDISILIEQLMHGGCEFFIRIIINLSKLSKFQFYLAIMLFFIEMGQRVNLRLQLGGILCGIFLY